MCGHQGDLVHRVLIFPDIHVGQKGDVFEELPDGDHRVFHLLLILNLTVGEKLLKILVLAVLHELCGAVDEFLDIGRPGLTLD